MKKILFAFLITGSMIFIACGSDDDATPTPQPTACELATTAATTAQNALPATSANNYSTKCNEYKTALQAKIAACGDTNGSIQNIIDGLGNCNNTVPNSITYDADVAPIFASNCTSCHGATPTNGAPSSFNTFTLVKNGVQNGNILTRINSSGNPMPPNGQMSQANRDIIQQWANDGYLEN